MWTWCYFLRRIVFGFFCFVLRLFLFRNKKIWIKENGKSNNVVLFFIAKETREYFVFGHNKKRFTFNYACINFQKTRKVFNGKLEVVYKHSWQQTPTINTKPTNHTITNYKPQRHQCMILEKNPIVNDKNKPLIVETLRQIAELMIWGDQNNDNFFLLKKKNVPFFFFFFSFVLFFFLAEKNILGNFLRIVRQKYDRDVTIQVLQTLSIMIQNISKQLSLYYLFSNNYINDMIVHDFDFMDNEILAYYVSFLKTISLKLDRD
ncbi:hypothetical protein RFI_10719, partial [Reticulomyxa filosa]